MAKKTKKYMKYFELSIEGAGDWGWRGYTVFVLESLYQTVFPFVAGMLLVNRRELIWLFMLALPIYFRFNIEKRDTKNRKKRIFIKD